MTSSPHHPPQPVLPFAGTSGWSGSSTSQERAAAADASGVTSVRQGYVLAAVDARQQIGMTVAELRSATGWHHGTASGTLSALHKEGFLARLKERRGRCEVYVTPGWVNGREVSLYLPNLPKRRIADALDRLEAALVRDDLVGCRGAIDEIRQILE